MTRDRSRIAIADRIIVLLGNDHLLIQRLPIVSQVFAKRFWGFDPIRWPIISFGLEANRDALIRASRPGDVIAFIGTQTDPTDEMDRGRFLGLAEIGRIPIDTLDVLDPVNIRAIDYNADGLFKWPKALPILRAWRFTDRPKVTEVLREQLSYEATVRAVLLSEDDQAAVLELRKEEVPVPDLELIRRHQALNDALVGSGPTRGPTPTSWSGIVTRDAEQSATTYAFRFGRRNLWKIGHAQDPIARLAEVNKHIPHEVLDERWSIAWKQVWPSQEGAYQMEQHLFELLADKRTHGERVACTDEELKAAWISAMMPTRASR